jgi:NitT/TauT family transport system substrate-binding protein
MRLKGRLEAAAELITRIPHHAVASFAGLTTRRSSRPILCMRRRHVVVSRHPPCDQRKEKDHWEEHMRLKSTLAVAGMLVFGMGAASAQSPVKIRGAWVAPVTNWASIWLEKKDLAKHFGGSYVFEAVRFQGTPPMITAIANNELEVSNLAYSTLAIAIQNAGLDDIRVIADEFQDGVPGYYTQEYMVLTDGAVKKVEDLKGKVVATNAGGSAVDVAMKAMLRKFGLEDKRDYTMVEAPFPAMRAMLAEKKVDMIPAVLPFSLDPELRKIGRALFNQRDAIGVTQMIVWTARKSFIDKNRAALVDYMEDTLRIVRWYLDEANHKEAMEIAARVTKQPPERFDWIFTKKDTYRDPDMKPNLDALQRNVDMTKDLGFVKASFEVKKYTDLSVVEEAAKRLK